MRVFLIVKVQPRSNLIFRVNSSEVGWKAVVIFTGRSLCGVLQTDCGVFIVFFLDYFISDFVTEIPATEGAVLDAGADQFDHRAKPAEVQFREGVFIADA